MAIVLTSAYLNQLKKGSNTPNVIIELFLDNETVLWTTSALKPDGGLNLYGSPIISKISSLQSKIDTSKGFSTLGKFSFTVTGRDNWIKLIKGNYLKHRRVVRREGFVADGFLYSDYAITFRGKISNWNRKGDDLIIEVVDDLEEGKTKIPTETARKNQYIDYRNTNPVDAMLDILSTQLGIDSTYINTTAFEAERDQWLAGWKVNRVLTDPKAGSKFLSQLQQETNSFIFHDGQRISFKVYAPVAPGQTVEKWNDNSHILDKSLTQESGYKDHHFTRAIVYYDYMEKGGNSPENYQSIFIFDDASASSTGEWLEPETKEIYSKWIRSLTHTQTTFAGVNISYVSFDNSIGTGKLYLVGGVNKRLMWQGPGDTAFGSLVDVNKGGRYEIFGASTNKSIMAVVDTSAFAALSTSQDIEITALQATVYAGQLAQKTVRRFRDPASKITFEIDKNAAAWKGNYIQPTDFKDITSDDIFDIDTTAWNNERVMITSLRPLDAKDRIKVEALQSRFSDLRYGFIAPAGYPDYTSASIVQKEYAFIGNSSNEVGATPDDGYYIW